jgi:hypothetical protein
MKTENNVALASDSQLKRLEKQIAIRNYRVSITNPNDAIARKGYNFQVARSARPPTIGYLSRRSSTILVRPQSSRYTCPPTVNNR